MRKTRLVNELDPGGIPLSPPWSKAVVHHVLFQTSPSFICRIVIGVAAADARAVIRAACRLRAVRDAERAKNVGMQCSSRPFRTLPCSLQSRHSGDIAVNASQTNPQFYYRLLEALRD